MNAPSPDIQAVTRESIAAEAARRHGKLLVHLRGWLAGRGYFKALEAMEFSRPFYTGLRKDGLTPKFDHPVRIALRLRTIEAYLPEPELCFVLSFTHDVSEDDNVAFEEIGSRFGRRAEACQRLITKKFRGVQVDDAIYYPRMAEDADTAMVKGSDNCHNIFTMVNAFDVAKQDAYMSKSEQHVLPMLKAVSRRFPRFEPGYMNLRVSLETQIALIREVRFGAQA